MGRLKDFRSYLSDRREVLSKAEKSLARLQEKYESFFSEVTRVRESEFDQLRSHILADRSKLPPGFVKALDEAEVQAEKDFSDKLAALEEKRAGIAKQAEKKRKISMQIEKKFRKENVTLDREEERLKARNETLLAQIKEFNRRIKELGRGFGFFSNLFRMRKLQKERRRLNREQADVAARIDNLRKRWVARDTKHAEQEDKLQSEWVELSTEGAALQTKIEHLESARLRIIQRTAIEQVLFARMPALPEPAPGDPPCPRCKQPNPATHHFCRICAHRLTGDRPDFDGSIREIAEINLHHQRFSEGMQACQEIIGLVRGLISGVDAFCESVEEMIGSEKKYPLPKLQIEVPAKSVSFGGNFDKLEKASRDDHSLHPKIFATQIQSLIAEVYTEGNIKDYFETMGAELSRQADKQW